MAKNFCHVRKGFAIIFLGLVSEAEECKENEGADRRSPTRKIHGDDEEMVAPPKECRDLFDTEVIKVGIFPTSPGAYGRGGCVEPDREDGEWGCQQDFRGSERHESKVATHGERRCVRIHELAEFETAATKGTKGEHWKGNDNAN